MRLSTANSAHYHACHACDLLVAVPPLRQGQQALCPRCGELLLMLPRRPLQRPLVYGLTSLVMLVCANLLPFLSIRSQGLGNSMTLFEAASTLFHEDYRLLSLLVYLCMQLLPLICLLLICYLFIGFRLWRVPPFGASACRWLFWLQPWTMVEVFLVGVMVSLIKIASLAEVGIGSGFWCFVVFCLSYLKTVMHLDRGWLWQRLRGPVPLGVMPIRECMARELELARCHGCGALVPEDRGHCPRCHGHVQLRSGHSLQRCMALLVTACLLYIPANILPIMVTETLGSDTHSTILGGVVLLWEHGSYPVALVIFVASVVVPIAKILALFWLCHSVYRAHPHRRRGRTRLYRLTEFVGRWSMVDVFVVAVLAALIRMGKLMSIYPGIAAMAFAAVVVMTMLAAMAFDPRLIWDVPLIDKETDRD